MRLTINPHEMQRMKKLLGQASCATKLNLGRWKCSKEEPYPLWHSVSKAPLWNDIDLADLRAALSRPLIEPRVELSDKEKTTWVWLTASQGNEEPSGPHIEALPIDSGKALPNEVALRNYSMVCIMHCHRLDCSKTMPQKSTRRSEHAAAR